MASMRVGFMACWRECQDNPQDRDNPPRIGIIFGMVFSIGYIYLACWTQPRYARHMISLALFYPISYSLSIELCKRTSQCREAQFALFSSKHCSVLFSFTRKYYTQLESAPCFPRVFPQCNFLLEGDGEFQRKMFFLLIVRIGTDNL